MGLVPFIHLLVTAVQDYITFLATFFSLSVKSQDDVSCVCVYTCMYMHVCFYLISCIITMITVVFLLPGSD